MNTPSMDELVLLPETLALHKNFDARNYRLFRWLLGVLAVLSLAAMAAFLGHGESFRPVLFGIDLLVTLALFALRREPLFERYFRQVLLSYMVLQLVLPVVWTFKAGHPSAPFLIVFPLLLIALRLRAIEHLLLYGAFWVAVLWTGLGGEGPPASEAERWTFGGFEAGMTILTLVCLGIAVGLTHVEKRRFLAVWRREHSRARERLRMREEIEQARKIQLSMLPQKPPDLGWVDFAAASLPATEVGGDYYEFFRLSESRLALVIGDVAGHGLASGLLLSGVRSCLYLLEEELAAPVEVLERINRMVRRTTDRRMFVTLLLILLDREAGTLRLASAGHPQLLHYSRRRGRLEAVGDGHPPLGTSLPVTYAEEVRPIEPEDLLVLYTDGLIEARDREGREYGEERLARNVARLAASGSAREVRDTVLGDLSNFKGDEEQADDMTLVVLKLR